MDAEGRLLSACAQANQRQRCRKVAGGLARKGDGKGGSGDYRNLQWDLRFVAEVSARIGCRADLIFFFSPWVPVNGVIDSMIG